MIVNNQDGKYTVGREERWAEGIKLTLNLLLKKPKNQKIKILDVGCGDGFFYDFLISEANKNQIDINRIDYCGIDSNHFFQKSIDNIKGKFICCNILHISQYVGSDIFDIVIASEIIEHIDETDNFINEIKKIVKFDGYIYLTTPNLAAWHCRLMLLLGFQPLPTEVSNIDSTFGKGEIGKKYYSNGTIHHIRIFTYLALKEFLQYHNLDIVKVIGGGYRKVDRLFRSRLIGLSSLIIVILKKRQIN